MEFGLCPVLHPHTPYVSSVITFRSLFGAQWQRDWVGHSLTTVSVSHRQGREYADTLNTHREESVCHCGLVQFPKLGLRCCPEILNTVDHSVFSALAFFVCYNNQSVDTVILYVCLLSCMFFQHIIYDVYSVALQPYKQNFLPGNRWRGVMLYCIINQFYCPHKCSICLFTYLGHRTKIIAWHII